MKMSTVNAVKTAGMSEIGDYSINPDNIQHVAFLLRSAYSNPELAVLREYAANARDAHVDAGKPHLPVHIEMPHDLNDRVLTIRDEGKGISTEAFPSLFCGYGGSDKRDSNEGIGGLGIGCKSAFSLVDSFTVINRNHGMETIYSCFLGDSGVGNYSILHQEPTERSGLEVRIPVSRNQAEKMQTLISDLFTFWPVQPEVTCNTKELNKPDQVASIEFEEYRLSYLETYTFRPKNLVVMGGLTYPIPSSICEALPNSRSWAFGLEVPIGTFPVAPSREDLMWTEQTREKITKILETGLTYLHAEMKRQTEIPGKSPFESLMDPKRWVFDAGTPEKPLPYVQLTPEKLEGDVSGREEAFMSVSQNMDGKFRKDGGLFYPRRAFTLRYGAKNKYLLIEDNRRWSTVCTVINKGMVPEVSQAPKYLLFLNTSLLSEQELFKHYPDLRGIPTLDTSNRILKNRRPAASRSTSRRAVKDSELPGYLNTLSLGIDLEDRPLVLVQDYNEVPVHLNDHWFWDSQHVHWIKREVKVRVLTVTPSNQEVLLRNHADKIWTLGQFIKGPLVRHLGIPWSLVLDVWYLMGHWNAGSNITMHVSDIVKYLEVIKTPRFSKTLSALYALSPETREAVIRLAHGLPEQEKPARKLVKLKELDARTILYEFGIVQQKTTQMVGNPNIKELCNAVSRILNKQQ